MFETEAVKTQVKYTMFDQMGSSIFFSFLCFCLKITLCESSYCYYNYYSSYYYCYYSGYYGLAAGAIIGIVIGVLVAIGTIVTIVIIVCIKACSTNTRSSGTIVQPSTTMSYVNTAPQPMYGSPFQPQPVVVANVSSYPPPNQLYGANPMPAGYSTSASVSAPLPYAGIVSNDPPPYSGKH